MAHLAVFNSAAFLTDAQLAVAANATIEVRRESDSALADIYSDRDGNTGITNPSAFADASGRFTFYAAWIDEGYSVEVTSGAESFTLHNVLDLGPMGAQVAAAEDVADVQALIAQGVTSRSSDTALAAADIGKSFVATSSFTQTFVGVSTLGDGWYCRYRVPSGVTITFDPSSTEQIDGATTKAVVGPASGIIVCSGSALFTYGFDNPAASDTVPGVIEIATQAEQEAGTDATLAVTPGRQQYHPSAAKAWVSYNQLTPAILASYNVTSVTDSGFGDATVNFTVAFSSTAYAVCQINEAQSGSPTDARQVGAVVANGGRATGSCRLLSGNMVSGGLQDSPGIMASFFGDQ